MLPIADPLDQDRIRLYFSSRDARGRSRVGRLDLGLASGTKRFDERSVIDLGPLGAFDDSGVLASCLVKHDGRQFLYYIGWSLGVTVPFYVSIGCAVSEDAGRTFSKVSTAPVLGRSPADPFFATSPWVLVDGGKWRMWYTSCKEWRIVGDRPKHYYRIKYAESSNGIDWHVADRVCIDFASEDEYAISRACVVREKDFYRMWYSYRGEHYRIGYAESRDGVAWTRKDEMLGLEVSSEGWDSEMVEYPFVFDHGGIRQMLYNGNGYGRTGVGRAVLDESA